MSKIFVGNFSFSVTSDKLKDFFSKAGTVISAKVMTEGEGGRSRGFGFVEMATPEEARKAIEELNGATWEGRQIKVSEDRGPRKTYGQGQHGRGGDYRQEQGEGRDSGYSQNRYPTGPYTPLGYFRAQPLDLGTRKHKKIDPFVEDAKLAIDYKDPRILKRFMSERGKILPRRMTGLTAAHQRQVSRAIKRAQHLALLSFTDGA